jgi:hypothetical protein
MLLGIIVYLNGNKIVYSLKISVSNKKVLTPGQALDPYFRGKPRGIRPYNDLNREEFNESNCMDKIRITGRSSVRGG